MKNSTSERSERGAMRRWMGAAIGAGMIALCSTTGCSTAPDEMQEAEPAATSEDALGRDPANCYFHHRYRKYNTTCTYASPPQRSAVENVATHVSGVGSCVGFAVAVGTLATTSVTIVLTPAAVAAGVGAVGSAAGCGLWISELLRGIIPTSCTTVEVQVTDRERSDRCAMACGGTQRVYNGDCYCGRVPLACNDPAPVVTPTPGACNVNWGDGCFNTTSCFVTTSGRANCSGTRTSARGSRVLNIEGNKYYSCTSSGWRACR